MTEGSRSRTGKAMVPKSGLLSIVVNAVLEGSYLRLYFRITHLLRKGRVQYFRVGYIDGYCSRKYPYLPCRDGSEFRRGGHQGFEESTKYCILYYFVNKINHISYYEIYHYFCLADVVPDVLIVPVNISYEKANNQSIFIIFGTCDRGGVCGLGVCGM